MGDAEFEAYLTFDPSHSITNSTGLEDYSGLTSELGDKVWPASPVKDQGSCGSCWAFAAVAGMEASAITQFGENAILSEQQLVDCTTEKNKGCDGGWASDAYDILKGKPLYTESSYPYKAVDG